MALVSIRIERPVRPERREPARRRAVPVAVAAVAAAGALAVAGIAGAAPTSSTTDVAIVPLTLGHKVLSNVTISANKTTSPVVAGASTTVPTNATTVRLTVTAKGAKAGVLNFYPAGNLGGGSGQSLAYPAGTLVSTTIQENVGQSNELTFANAGTASVVVNATLTGYSTQVTAGDIGGTGGSNGQVLTNNGSGGAAWQNLPPVTAAGISGDGGTAGQILTNTGSGAAWQTPNFQSALTATTVIHPTGTPTQNGDALRAALTSGTRPVVEIEAGEYDLGSASLSPAPGAELIGAGPLQSDVLLHGPGQLIMSGIGGRIENTRIGLIYGAQILVGGTASSTFENDLIAGLDGTTTDSIVDLVVNDSGTAVIDDSTVYTLGAGPYTQAILQNSPNGTLTVKNSTIDSTASSGANTWAVNAFGSATLEDDDIVVDGPGPIGLLEQGSSGTFTVYSSRIRSSTALGISAGQFQIADTLIGGGVSKFGGTVTCVGTFNSAFTPLGTGCT
jgi:hypothetical protein